MNAVSNYLDRLKSIRFHNDWITLVSCMEQITNEKKNINTNFHISTKAAGVRARLAFLKQSVDYGAHLYEPCVKHL